MATVKPLDININKDDPTKTLSTYDPSKIVMEPGDTVEGRIPGIIASNSPLMEQAKTASLQQMNSRGIINSSMAVGAGQDAVMKSAIPIASQDAATSFAAKQANQAAENTAGEFGAGSINTAVYNQQKIGADTAAQAKQLENDLILAQKSGDIQAIRDATKIAADTAAQAKQFENDLILAQKNGDIQAARDATLNLYNVNNQAQNQKNAVDLLKIQNDFQVTLNDLQRDQQKDLAKINFDYQKELAGNAAAVNLYGQVMGAIATLGANPDLTSAQRQAGVDQQMSMLRAGLDLVKSTTDLYLPIITAMEDQTWQISGPVRVP